jgi:hypothetical protein
MRRFLIVLLVAAASCFFCVSALAGQKWVHTRGSFENVEGTRWVEKARVDGPDVEFHFVEQRRTGEYVELYDDTRDCYVRIYDQQLAYRCPREGKHDYAICYRGTWAIENLHMLFVIDTHSAINRGAGDVSDYTVRCLEQLTGVFTEAIDANKALFEGKITTTILTGDEVTPENVRNQYRSGMPGANASGQFFYYAGHGAFDRAKGRYLYTSGGDITCTEIRNILNGTGARSIVMITESCGSYAEFEPPQRRVPAKWKVFHKLFFESTGIVEINSSTEGEFSWGNGTEGGMFTRTLCKYLCEPADSIRGDGLDGEATWEDFFDRVREGTLRLFAETREPIRAYYEAHPEAERSSSVQHMLDSKAQTPFAAGLGGFGEQWTRNLIVKNNTRERVCVWLKFYDRNYETEEWGWYPAQGGALRYEVEPGASFRPHMDGFPIEAHAVVFWANSAASQGIWGSQSAVVKTVETGYVGPVETTTLEIEP